MKKFLSGLMPSALAASFAVAAGVPAGAAPMAAPSVPAAFQDVQKVQDWRWRRFGDHVNSDHMRYAQGQRPWVYNNNGWRGRDNWRGGDRWRGSDWRGGNWRGHGDGYWRGHRGYRYWRNGYREYNGWWYPLAAFTAGAVIGNVLSEPRVIYREGGDAHVQWCYNRYRSYRAYDNTFQPYNGPRRQCYSPYG
ncbi:BA14K family protein [Arvimicrobium flavum]|uniref:BA14K family protein n=1 Tax=Arvimicrobium flavum TaxID=3393320 RepID=UPI00237A31CF|nr:BA14K family protein [Mesorhizobium shangrilense]